MKREIERKDRMLRPAEEGAVDIVCISDCVVPGHGPFKHGQKFTSSAAQAAVLLSNPCFKKSTEVE